MLDTSYSTFCDLLTGYRMFSVINQAVQTGIIDLLDGCAIPADQIVMSVGIRPEEGERFISLLLDCGILRQCDEGKVSLSSFAQSWLAASSPTCQRGVLAFEPILMENWNKLGVVLKDGQQKLVTEKTPEECSRRLNLFQLAMGEAAVVRSGELWNAVTGLPEEGRIIDIGAGDALYLKQFMKHYPRWKALASDLPDVCRRQNKQTLPPGVEFYPCNLLDQHDMSLLTDQHGKTADVVLLSNICHCYSEEENSSLLNYASKLLKQDGILIVHDFFRDISGFSAMYDLHLMVNTYNGRCFSTSEMGSLLTQGGFMENSTITLPSGSVALIYSRYP